MAHLNTGNNLKNHEDFDQNNQDNNSLYICRRIQLLRNTEKKPEKWKNYLKMRSMLLKQHLDCTEIDNQNMINTLSNDKLHITSTKEANASRAIVGDNSISENYSFVGVYHIFDQHKESVSMVKFANNNPFLLSCCSADGKISICEVKPGSPKVIGLLIGHTKAVTAIDWSVNNDVIASTSLDGTVKVWCTSTLRCLSSISDPSSAEMSCCLFQPANNNLVVIGNNIGELRTVNISTSRFIKEICKIGGSILSLAFNTIGDILWAGNDRGEIYSVICKVNGRIFKARKIAIPDGCSVTSLSYKTWVNREARDPMLLVNSANNHIYLFSIVDSEGRLSYKRKFPLHHEKHPIKSTFCPLMSFRQGACIVTGSEDGNIYFIDVEKPPNRACFNTLQGHSKAVLGVSFNCDELLLATSDRDGLVIVWKRADLD